MSAKVAHRTRAWADCPNCGQASQAAWWKVHRCLVGHRFICPRNRCVIGPDELAALAPTEVLQFEQVLRSYVDERQGIT